MLRRFLLATTLQVAYSPGWRGGRREATPSVAWWRPEDLIVFCSLFGVLFALFLDRVVIPLFLRGVSVKFTDVVNMKLFPGPSRPVSVLK
jgi:hypothetical protein